MLTFVIKPELLQRSSAGSHTKRRVLSIVMSIFDPLGLLGFFNARAKIILQNIWRSGVSWDDAIKEPDEIDWNAAALDFVYPLPSKFLSSAGYRSWCLSGSSHFLRESSFSVSSFVPEMLQCVCLDRKHVLLQ